MLNDMPQAMQKDITKTFTQKARQDAIRVLREMADLDHSQYPQYEGHWDGWDLCQVNRRVRTKMGLAFTKGELAIFTVYEEPESPLGQDGIDRVVVYSTRNKCDTVLQAKDITKIG